ncbi:MAG: PQQ-binding-like beta-propeller repeat protein [Pirellulaceae bacterium]|nr:PQQ-binding-like beta-propeller repeat protein [Pirellulaceae bacterium]
MTTLSRQSLVCSLAAVLLVLTSAALAAEPVATTPGEPAASFDWNQWRGPTRDGQLPGPAWPPLLDETHWKPLWRVPLGPSYSGPLVVGNRVFTTQTRDKTTEVVSAHDRETGQTVWQVEWPGSVKVPFFAAANGDWIRATPACDGERLYVAGIRDVLVCLQAADGKELWRVDFVEQLKTPVPAFGFVSSPLVVGEHLYVQAGAAVVKLNKRDGKVVWRSLEDGGGMWGSAFSSPVLASLGGREQLVVQTREKLAGLDPETGKPLWTQEVPAFRGMNILTPTILGDAVFTSSYGGKSLLYRLAASGSAVDEVWQNKTQGYMSSPVVIGGHAYLHLRNQRLTCIDLATGQEKWTTTPFGKYWSMIARGDRILALDERGDLRLIRATPEKYEELSSRKIADDETWAHLAMAGNQIFIRELGALAAYRWE